MTLMAPLENARSPGSGRLTLTKPVVQNSSPSGGLLAVQAPGQPCAARPVEGPAPRNQTADAAPPRFIVARPARWGLKPACATSAAHRQIAARGMAPVLVRANQALAKELVAQAPCLQASAQAVYLR